MHKWPNFWGCSIIMVYPHRNEHQQSGELHARNLSRTYVLKSNKSVCVIWAKIDLFTTSENLRTTKSWKNLAADQRDTNSHLHPVIWFIVDEYLPKTRGYASQFKKKQGLEKEPTLYVTYTQYWFMHTYRTYVYIYIHIYTYINVSVYIYIYVLQWICRRWFTCKLIIPPQDYPH